MKCLVSCWKIEGEKNFFAPRVWWGMIVIFTFGRIIGGVLSILSFLYLDSLNCFFSRMLGWLIATAGPFPRCLSREGIRQPHF